MGNSKSSFHSSYSVSDLSSQLECTLQLNSDPDHVISGSGEVRADGIMSVKISNKTISVPKPSKVFWVGVLLRKKSWIHSGIGLHNDITVEFEDGTTKSYQYVVAHGVGWDKALKIHLCFANTLHGVHRSLARAFETEIDYSFKPVFAGDSWTTSRCADGVVAEMEKYLGRPVNMQLASRSDTNCIHFSAAMYLYFACKESKQSEIMSKVAGEMSRKEYTALLTKLEKQLDAISA